MPSAHTSIRRGVTTALAFTLVLLVAIATALGPGGTAPAAATTGNSASDSSAGGADTNVAGAKAKGPAKRDANGLYVSSPTANGAPAPKPWAESWVLGSLDNGDILSQKKPDKKLWPASVLKLLTGLALVDEFPDRTKKYTASATCEKVDGTAVGLERGHTYTIDQLFHAMLMMSANDASYALAEAAGGQKQALALMNKKAKQIGMSGTVAKNPNGLDAKGQAMTTRDLMVLAKHFTENKYLMKVVGTKTYKFSNGLSKKQLKAQKKRAKAAKRAGRKSTRVPASYEVANHTKMVGKYKGGLGLKNGYTIKAKGSFVAVAKRGEKTYVAAILKSTDPPRQPAMDMLSWAFKQKSPKTVANIDFAAIDKTPKKHYVKPQPTGQAAKTQAATAKRGQVFSDSASLWGGGLLLVIVMIGIGLIVGKRARRSQLRD